jgi:hypothetical protein
MFRGLIIAAWLTAFIAMMTLVFLHRQSGEHVQSAGAPQAAPLGAQLVYPTTQLFFSCNGDYKRDGGGPGGSSPDWAHDAHKETASLILDETKQSVRFTTGNIHHMLFDSQRGGSDIKKQCPELELDAEKRHVGHSFLFGCSDVFSDETSMWFKSEEIHRTTYPESKTSEQTHTLEGKLDRVTGHLKVEGYSRFELDSKPDEWTSEVWDMTCKKVDKPLF